MNEVYVSGTIIELNLFSLSADTGHFSFLLQVTHRNHEHQIILDDFIINAWNGLAQWATSNLHIGDEVVVKGTLTQRLTSDSKSTEISALRIIVTQHSNNKFRNEVFPQN